jgi:hypothetical protein
MVFGEIVKYFIPRNFNGPDAMTAHQHMQERRSRHDPDPEISTLRSATRVRNEGEVSSEPASSPDPLCIITTTPEADSYHTYRHEYNNLNSNKQYEPATGPEQNTPGNTRANSSGEAIKVQLEKDEDPMDLDSIGSGSDSRIAALADARKTIQSREAQLCEQKLINDEGNEFIDQWMMQCSQQQQLLDEKGLEIDALHSAQKRFQRDEAELKGLLHDQKSKLRHIHDRLQESMRINRQLEKCLEDCKERIFRSQPFQGPTDMQLVNMYEGLCDSVDKWVHRSVADGDNTIVQLGDVQNHATCLVALERYFDPVESLAIPQIPAIRNVMVGSVIMRIIHGGILHDRFSRLGLDTITNNVLDGVVSALGELEPAKGKQITQGSERTHRMSDIGLDFEDCQSWRVDLQRALSISCGLRENTARALKTQCDSIIQAVKMVGISDEPFDDIRKGCEDFLLEAAKLAEGISHSTNSYEFIKAFATDAPGEHRFILAKDLKNFNVIDSRTGSGLRPQSKPIADSTGKVGEMVCNVFPSLKRHDNTSKGDIVLCKATIVAHFDHPIPPVGKKKNTS